MTFDIALCEWAGFCRRISEFTLDLFGGEFSYEVDHVAINVSHGESIERFLGSLDRYGHLVSSKDINGRPVYVFQLDSPFSILGSEVSVLEVLTPKKDGHHFTEGWDHIEVVFPCDLPNLDSLYLQLASRHPELADKLENDKTLTVKNSQPRGEGESIVNPTISVKADNNLVKIHPYSLMDVIHS